MKNGGFPGTALTIRAGVSSEPGLHHVSKILIPAKAGQEVDKIAKRMAG
jgi:hypothetical protein